MKKIKLQAIILRGKHKGEVFEVSQWCNDWFMLESDIPEVARKVFSPTVLGFNEETFQYIKNHENNGMLFEWFAAVSIHTLKGVGDFVYTFKRKLV